MKIWIDGYEANVEQRLGSSQVAFELLNHFENLDQKNEYTILLPTPPLNDLPKQRADWIYRVLKPAKLWTRIALPLALYRSKDRPDIFFSPTHYIPRFSPVKRVVTIFDLAYLHFPEMFPRQDLWKLTNWTKFSVENADHIITISNFTKKDILENYHIKSDLVTLAYPGFNNQLYHPNPDKEKTAFLKKKYETGEDYLIYVGTIQPRKNLIRLMEAFGQVLKDHPTLKLIIVGKTSGAGRQGWMYEDILSQPAKLEIESQVIFTGFVPTEELPYLISGAVAFVLPSLWEGFGIPPLEAMACGTPVIVSNVSSLPEVVGSAGLLVDPYSVEQIAQAIRTIYADKKLRVKMSKAGLEQVKKFSWEKMTKTVIKVFENVVEG